MAKGIYIASSQPGAGKSLAALGLMEVASRRVERLGFFRPIVAGPPDADREIQLMRTRYALSPGAEALTGCPYEEARALVRSDGTNELLARCLERYKEIEADCDFVVCEGTDHTGVGGALEFELNARVAGHLGTPVFFVANGAGRTPEAIREDVHSARLAFEREGSEIVALLINRVAPEQVAAVQLEFTRNRRTDIPVYVVPAEPSLGYPTIEQVMVDLDGRLLFGDERRLQSHAAGFVVAAMGVPNLLTRLKPGVLVITGGDRSEVLLACLASVPSESMPNIAGVVLTGGLEPPEPVQRLIRGLRRSALPVIGVPFDTFASATAANVVRGAIRAGDDRKIATALGLFEEHVDVPQLEERIRVSHSERVTPLRFEYELIQRAKRDRQHIVLPEGDDERVLRAAEILLRRRVVDITLLGEPRAIHERAATLGVHLEGANLIDPRTSEWHEEFVATYLELRAHKGITRAFARDAMVDASYFGSMMVHKGLADGMVSGAAHTTAHTIRPALEFIKTKPGVSIVSSVFLMCLHDRVLVYADCAVNPNPDAAQLADIAISSAETAARFGITPRVAMLSYSTGSSGDGADVAHVREATAIARALRPDLPIEGPMQYDAAVDPDVARKKLPDSRVAGNATVFIFPDLNTGNNTYKAVQRSAGAVAIGPILQGLNRPVNDLSRGCTVLDIVNTVAVTAIQAQVGE
jgi:phosphate acetyltransferase